MNSLLAKGICKFFLGKEGSFTLSPVARTTKLNLPPLTEIGLYIHIPFCRNICPYCPFNKIRYDKSLVEPYLKAVLAELDMYHNIYGRLTIPSIYIGGGTPTTLLDELGIIIQKIRDNFNLIGDISLETTPTDLIDREQTIAKLIDFGVSHISLGIQSFNDKHLHLIGRDYKSSILYPIIERSLAYKFKTVNLDLMFAMPNQTVAESLDDLQTAINAGVNQITLYPMFTFPFSPAGKYLKITKSKAPSLFTKQNMYYKIHDLCLENGFERATVWSFRRNKTSHCTSTLTREYYLGIDAGSVSHLPGLFYINTFIAKVYIATCLNKRLPIALKMNASDKVEHYHWLYCQFYNGTIYKKTLTEHLGLHNKKINSLFKLLKFSGFCNETDSMYTLTKSGAFWFHLIQKKLVFAPIEKVWATAIKDPWPQEIHL